MRERFEGFQDVFGSDLSTIDLPNEIDRAKEAVARFLPKKGKRVTAVVALSETIAIGALMGLRDLGLQISEDISFASFDDFPLASHWSPPSRPSARMYRNWRRLP